MVEVYGDEAKAWAETHGAASRQAPGDRPARRRSATRDDAKPLLADLATRANVRYLHRPANLEDLFIKLTGRELRD